MIKDRIRETFLGRYLISELHCVESWLLPKLISDETAVKKYYRSFAGKELDLRNPQTFSEKLNWYKLNGHDPLMVTCADKYAVREYVTSKGYADTLNELYGVYDSAADIDLSKLPEQFVLKAAHGSHMNFIVKDKKNVNWRQIKMMLRSWLHQDIYWSGREWVYKDIPRRIIAEKYLEDETGELRDYKFFCFSGEVAFMQVDTGRYSGIHCRTYFDANMNMLQVHDDCRNDSSLEVPIKKDVFVKMKEIACNLSTDFQHVRVDFYCLHDEIIFGELTFFHNGGNCRFEPNEYELIFGEKWKILS